MQTELLVILFNWLGYKERTENCRGVFEITRWGADI